MTPDHAAQARANFLPAPAAFLLNAAATHVTAAWGHGLYLVGSCLATRDYRDVDLRLIVSDEDFDRLFPRCPAARQFDARWSLICASISLYLSTRSGLPVDFQIQSESEANQEPGPRHAFGIHLIAAAIRAGEGAGA